ncbi:hypothetical protein RB3882 [Rhodopirellula baltica SH 1]|uniref:Uncharacterized protein n=1 Tax=Rhodopirellula baltica (strain DSM 10527 / NCIMB 13988 / SH1) TaxID=243090 RepID=Q7UTH3_RHOBA|nr:hypothetical protein RB3882 [Rhodopirellula baltica SH 1]
MSWATQSLRLRRRRSFAHETCPMRHKVFWFALLPSGPTSYSKTARVTWPI